MLFKKEKKGNRFYTGLRLLFPVIIITNRANGMAHIFGHLAYICRHPVPGFRMQGLLCLPAIGALSDHTICIYVGI